MAVAPLRSARFLFLPPPLSIGAYQSAEGGGGQRSLVAEQRGALRRRGQKRRRPRWMFLLSFLRRVQLPADKDKEEAFRPLGSMCPRRARLFSTAHSFLFFLPRLLSPASFALAAPGSERAAREAGSGARGAGRGVGNGRDRSCFLRAPSGRRIRSQAPPCVIFPFPRLLALGSPSPRRDPKGGGTETRGANATCWKNAATLPAPAIGSRIPNNLATGLQNVRRHRCFYSNG